MVLYWLLCWFCIKFVFGENDEEDAIVDVKGDEEEEDEEEDDEEDEDEEDDAIDEGELLFSLFLLLDFELLLFLRIFVFNFFDCSFWFNAAADDDSGGGGGELVELR